MMYKTSIIPWKNLQTSKNFNFKKTKKAISKFIEVAFFYLNQTNNYCLEKYTADAEAKS